MILTHFVANNAIKRTFCSSERVTRKGSDDVVTSSIVHYLLIKQRYVVVK